MLTLSTYRYRNILADHGGPVDRIETCDVGIEGRRCFQSNAYLRSDLVRRRSTNVLFGNADGSGTSASPLIARHKAVSEAMERWAYYACIQSEDRGRYGFDVDPTSTGMAAFPGVWARQARRRAYFEAVERHSNLAWWEGKVPGTARQTPWVGITAWVIWEAPGEVALILHKQCEVGFHVYGRAAAPTFEEACRHALVELARREYVSRSYRLAHAGVLGTPPPSMGILERRSLFFSTQEGYESCLLRLALRPVRSAPKRFVVHDGPIRGPWTPYADVWRVLFEPPSHAFMNNDERYFMI